MPKEKTIEPVRLAAAGGGPEESLGNRVKKLRQDAGWSLLDLEVLTGLSRTALQNYEAGIRLPGALQLRALSEQLNCSAHFLVFGDEWSPTDRQAEASFFGELDYDLYVAKLGAAVRALPASDREAVERLIESLLVGRGKVGRKRLERIAWNASWWLTRLTVDASVERMPTVPAEGVPWEGGSFDPESQETPEKPPD